MSCVADQTIATVAAAPVNRVHSCSVEINGDNSRQPESPKSLMLNAEWSRCARILIDFLKLEENWDGHGACPIDTRAAENASRVLSLAITEYLAPDDIVPKVGGTISFIWQYDDREAELEIGKSRFVGFVETADKTLFLQGRPEEIDWETMESIRQLYQRARSHSLRATRERASAARTSQFGFQI